MNRQLKLYFKEILYLCKMRMIAIIIALLTISQSVDPCCVPKAIGDEAMALLSDGSHDCCPDENQDEKDCDENLPPSSESQCSPFYTCGSCGGFTYASFEMNFQTSHISIDLYSEYLNKPFESDYLDSKWQPPKFV